MRMNHEWGRVMWIGLLLLSACAPVAVVKEPSMPIETPRVAMPQMTVATFTPAPASEPAQESIMTLPDVPSAAETGAVTAVEALPFTYHTVAPGDTLLGLALKYGLPMAAIQLQNDLGNSLMLQAGQVLQIPPAVGWEGASPFWVVYEVQAGDVLSTIAADYGFDVATLQNVNGLADADLLSIGQALVLPLDAPAEHVLAQHRPTATPAPLPAATQAVAAAAPLATADAAAAPTVVATPMASPPVAAPALPADVAEFPAAVFRLINEQRAAYGLVPLSWNATLARAAQLHADDCYARGWCSHTGSDGSTMKERIMRQGYDPVRWSECWAWYATPEMAVAMWMDETPPNDPHRRTILSTWLTEVGVGVVPASNGRGYYFIADFGTPR